MVFLNLRIIPNIITTIDIISSIIIIWAFHSHGIFNFEPILKVGKVSRFRKSLFDNGHLHCVIYTTVDIAKVPPEESRGNTACVRKLGPLTSSSLLLN